MRVLRLFVIAVAALVSSPAVACRTPSGVPSRISREERLEQREIIADYAARSDQILLVRALNGPDAFPQSNNQLGGHFPGKFQTIKILKGDSPQILSAEVRWGVVVVSCGGGDFKQLVIESGGEYILYLRQGEILRAGPRDRPPGHITFKQELRQLRSL